MIIHQRRQYPVGQGCFHTGFVGTVANEPLFAQPGLRYVYDCGSMGKYVAAREAQIGLFHAETGKLPLDFLFLSHLHEDHVSGVELLCGPAGLKVDTIALPLLNAVDRLICFARAVAEDPGYDSEFHRALTADPAAALSRFNPRQIIFFRRGEGDTPTPGAPAEPTGDRPHDDGEHARQREGVKWRLVGSGKSEQRPTAASGTARAAAASATAIYDVDDTCAIAIDAPSAAAATMSWILAPYVDPDVSAAHDAFLQKAADLFGITKDEFADKALGAEWLLSLVTSHKAVLAQAYASIADLNVTSLCLFSGPYNDGPASWQSRLSFGSLWWHDVTVRVGWLGTGDADLKKPSRRQAFLKHYTPHLGRTGTLLLPHHGSEHNFDAALLDGTQPRLTVAAADAYSNWRHPGSAVIQATCARGLPLWVVTSSAVSGSTEFVWQFASAP